MKYHGWTLTYADLGPIGGGKKLASAEAIKGANRVSVSLEYDAADVGIPREELSSMLRAAIKRHGEDRTQ